MTAVASDKWSELRAPFPKEAIGILPKPFKRDSPKSTCPECNKYHGLPAVHLDYVGHAAVTDRLNTVVGPENWELTPMATDEHGIPLRNSLGELWCWLTILGARKMCVGDGSLSSKELIGDALRNGAMRFGIALDLWSKEELESNVKEPTPPADTTPAVEPPVKAKKISKEQVTALLDLARAKGYTVREEAIDFLNTVALQDFTLLPEAEFPAVRKAVLEHKRPDGPDATSALEGKL